MRRIAIIILVVVASVGARPRCALSAGDAAGVPLRVADAREVVLTFDDIPGVAIPGADCNRDAFLSVNRRIIETLRKHEAPALGLVVEGRCDGRFSKDLFSEWIKAGHDLGNHTYSHRDLNAMTVEDYTADIIRGEKTLRPLLKAHGRKLRYFRFPMLHSGNTKEKKEAVERFLAKRGYVNAVVTFDNQEWVFADVYSGALASGDKKLQQRVMDEYLDYMDSTYEYFEKLSMKTFGREIPQVLLLHANSLNADALDQLLVRLKKRGYKFITMDEAVKDPAYRSADRYVGRAGISWLQRWAQGKGIPLGSEPQEPHWLAELFKKRHGYLP